MIAGLLARWELFIYLFGGCLSLQLSSMVPFHFFDLVPEWPSFKCLQQFALAALPYCAVLHFSHMLTNLMMTVRIYSNITKIRKWLNKSKDATNAVALIKLL